MWAFMFSSLEAAQARSVGRCGGTFHQLVQTCASTRQPGHDRTSRDAEYFCDFGIREVFQCDQQEHRALFLGQLKQATLQIDAVVAP